MSTVFYSWQSDRRETKNYIHTALKGAVKKLKNESTLLDSPRLDRDTKDVNGAPDIVGTILAKIRDADIFVADVSIIGELSNGKSVINQNVAYELGYACGYLGDSKMILVFDKASGNVSSLPFDIRNRRLTFCNSIESSDKFKSDIIDIVGDMLSTPSTDKLELDAVGMAILGLYAHMDGARSVTIYKTLGGILPAYDHLSSGSETAKKKFESVDSGELLATLDDMVDKGILAVEIVGQSGNKKYSLAKKGYRLIKGLNNK